MIVDQRAWVASENQAVVGAWPEEAVHVMRGYIESAWEQYERQEVALNKSAHIKAKFDGRRAQSPVCSPRAHMHVH